MFMPKGIVFKYNGSTSKTSVFGYFFISLKISRQKVAKNNKIKMLITLLFDY
jgi:hypothetical protein